jgi:hypothetical protein
MSTDRVTAGKINGRLTKRSIAFAGRLNRYAELRRDGVGPLDAARELDIIIGKDGLRYERWFQAAERGEVELPAVTSTP